MSDKLAAVKNKASEPRVSCRVPRKLKTRLNKIATANGIDVSDVVRIALNRVLPEFEAPANAKEAA